MYRLGAGFHFVDVFHSDSCTSLTDASGIDDSECQAGQHVIGKGRLAVRGPIEQFKFPTSPVLMTWQDRSTLILQPSFPLVLVFCMDPLTYDW